MNREVHVRFWESPEVKVLRATRQELPPAPGSIAAQAGLGSQSQRGTKNATAKFHCGARSGSGAVRSVRLCP